MDIMAYFNQGDSSDCLHRFPVCFLLIVFFQGELKQSAV